MNDVQLFLVQFNSTGLDEEQFQLALAQLDTSSQQRARRFFHREDAWRFLLGRLLRHFIIKRIVETRVSSPIPGHLEFKETSTGKPYLSSPLSSDIGFNISHDSSAILFAVREARNTSISRVTVDVGVDVMKVQLPPGETFEGFVESLGDALTLQERDQLLALQVASHPSEKALQALYQIWTIKEAYTKALGTGLGFALSRIEYDIQKSIVNVDGKPLSGWIIDSFSFDGKEGQGFHRFVGSVCYKAPEKDGTLQGCKGQNVFVHPKPPASLQIVQPSTLLRFSMVAEEMSLS